MAKLPELREWAAKGSLDAIQMLIHRAVAHKHITASVTLADRHLEVLLWSPQVPDQKVSVTLLCRELTTWNHPCFDTITIRGKAINTQNPAWIYDIDLNAAADIENSLSQLASGTLTRSVAPVFRAATPARLSKPQIPVQKLDQSAVNAIVASLLLAILLSSSDQVRFLLHPLITLVHELGHAFFAWIFGYFAIPAFDFIFGGGITFQSSERSMVIMGAIAAGFIYLFYRYRNNYLTSRILLGFTVIYSICAFTPIHEMLIKFMGHGFELLFAGIFLYQALSGFGCRSPIERPLYGMLAFFILFSDLRFAFGLITDPDVRATYEAGKGGLLDNDFVLLARDCFNVDLSIVVAFFLLCCFFTPVMTYLFFRYQAFVLKWFSRLFLVTRDQRI
ncbi:hypothetical protein K9N68_33255 [Kovacikia minuta CCNUW1]|uniref:hypothetical protein n=1 Tax=Kovacikia minuta TaxID=2931930 RepID=UPI001CCDAF7C|nr:hypothetical protein [Kovacikia minuta]UBF26315.1 hypothetical protein K9N68_33255 [Kovacikia minuta CCNUW1]